MANIQFERVNFTYQGAENQALSDVSMTVVPGEFVGIWGANNSGKSTLLACVNGLIPHFHPGVTEGRVTVKGNAVSSFSPGYLARDVATVLQDFENQILGLEVEEEIGFGLEAQGIERAEITQRIEAVLKKFGMSGFEKRLMQQLSGGQKQKVILAAALAADTDILLLDEPTSALDTAATHHFFQELKQNHQHRSIIAASRNLNILLPYITRLIVLEQGKIIYDGQPGPFLRQRIADQDVVGLPEICKLAPLLRQRGVDQCPEFGSVVEAKDWITSQTERGNIHGNMPRNSI